MKKYLELLKLPGFAAFLYTQFFGAFNDNVFKIAISMLALQSMGDKSGVYISLIGAIFMLPFFFFSGYAGFAADRVNKRTILIYTKGLELIAMVLAFFSFLHGDIIWMLCVLFLMAFQTTFFSTAKYGILPEVLPEKELSRANALVELSTFFAIIVGTSTGGLLFSIWEDRMFLIGLVLIAVALIGFFLSFGIAQGNQPKEKHRFRINPWWEITVGFKRLYKNKMLWSSVLGIAYFGFLGAFLQMDFLLFGAEVMNLNSLSISLLGTFLAIGVGIGSFLAGRLSGDKVELGLVPLGSLGMGAFAVMLGLSGHSFSLTALALTLLGCAGGIFSVPLYAYLQQKSGKEERGQLIGTSNFLLTVGILSASGLLWLFHDVLYFGPDQIILVLGLFTLVMTPYIMKTIPQYLIRFSLWMMTHTIFSIRMDGQQYVPFRGPALLICNRSSYVDGLLVGACVQRFIRFMVDSSFFDIRGIGPLLHLMRSIPLGNGEALASRHAIDRGREALQQGHVLCVFTEKDISEVEDISKTEELLPLKKGFEGIINGNDVPIIPVHIEGLRGTIFSEQEGRFTWKWPGKLFLSVSISFGPALPATTNAQEVRQCVAELKTRQSDKSRSIQ